MVTAEGGVKIADSGSPRRSTAPPPARSPATALRSERLRYMAPELATGAEVGPVDRSLRLVGWLELLAGRLPFDDTEIALA